jgi:hypothetical protein
MCINCVVAVLVSRVLQHQTCGRAKHGQTDAFTDTTVSAEANSGNEIGKFYNVGCVIDGFMHEGTLAFELDPIPALTHQSMIWRSIATCISQQHLRVAICSASIVTSSLPEGDRTLLRPTRVTQ